jgi:dihydroorotate dehydrogenase
VFDYYRAVGPILSHLDPETAQRLTLQILRAGLLLPEQKIHSSVLQTQAAGLNFDNPLGIAAGLDKDAVTRSVLFRLGVSAVELGTITPLPQMPNEGKRLFRLPEYEAVINRFGFPSDGLEVVAARLKKNFPGLGNPARRIGVNIGPNRNSSDRVSDYSICLRRLYGFADYVVANVSSPNTPALRQLQRGTGFSRLAEQLATVRSKLGGQRRPIFFKISPDISHSELRHIVIETKRNEIDGLVIGNTTIGRPVEGAPIEGGLSGRPLFDMSTKVLAQAYEESDGELTLVGAGGIFDADDLYRKIRAGASFCQIYTCLYYRGPHVVPTILKGLRDLLVRDGYKNISEAVGSCHFQGGRRTGESSSIQIGTPAQVLISPNPLTA